MKKALFLLSLLFPSICFAGYKVDGSLLIIGGVGIGSTTASPYVTTTPQTTMFVVEGNIGIGTLAPGARLDIRTGGIRAVGIGTTTPELVCRKADGTFGTAHGASFNGTCN